MTGTNEKRRIGRIIGLLGGVVAIAWAMRDRFVSIAAPKEPEPPSFRVVSTPPPPPAGQVRPERTASAVSVQDPDDLTRINGVGPVFERRLMEAGLATFESIAAASARQVANAAGVTEPRAEGWITQASILMG